MRSTELRQPIAVHRFAIACGAVLAVAALLLWTVGAGSANEHQRSDAFWTAAYVRALEVEHYETTAALIEAADAVVVGRIADAVPGRVFGDPSEAAAFYVSATLQIDEVLRGDLSEGTAVTLELLVPREEEMPGMVASVPTERTIFFLRNKGAEARTLGLPVDVQAAEAPFYRLVMLTSYLREFDGAVHVGLGTEDEFLLALEGKNFDALVDQLRTSSD